jgi:N-acetylneuraminate synthase
VSSPEISIAGRKIGSKYPPFIIAELSANHQQSLAKAKVLIEGAASAGVSAIKLQTYKPSTMTLDENLPDFMISEPDSPWFGRRLHDLYSQGMTPWEWHQELFDYASSLGLIGFSSPFDDTAVALLESLNVPAYKIASFELTHHPLLVQVARTGKPVILSTGMATMEEIGQSIHILRSNGATQIALLKCTSTYPAQVADSNLATIPDMIRRFNVPVGLSDHTNSLGAAIASVGLGACILEKHIVSDKQSEALDASFSSTPGEFATLSRELSNVWQSVGKVSYGPTEAERQSLKYRRSLYFANSVQAGQILSPSDVVVIRPSFGLPPSEYSRVIGMRVSQDVSRGTPLSMELLTQGEKK